MTLKVCDLLAAPTMPIVPPPMTITLGTRATGRCWGYLVLPGLPGHDGNPGDQGYWQLLGLPCYQATAEILE